MLPKNRSLVSFRAVKINFRGETCLNLLVIVKSFSGLRAFSEKFKVILTTMLLLNFVWSLMNSHYLGKAVKKVPWCLSGIGEKVWWVSLICMVYCNYY